MNKDNENKTNNKYIKSLKQSQFLGGFSHIVTMEEDGDLPLIDPETGERRTYAVIGTVKIRKN